MKVIKLQVSEEKLNGWLRDKRQGDIQAIHDTTGLTKEKIRRAFNYGESDQETATAIDEYFKERNSKVIS